VIATYAALDAKAAGDGDAFSRQLELAQTHFELVPERVRDAEGRSTDSAYSIASALAEHDDQSLLLVLLELIAEEPQNWWLQQLLLQHMPSELSPSATDALRQVIEALDTRTLTSK
jgi:hypothetical protein